MPIYRIDRYTLPLHFSYSIELYFYWNLFVTNWYNREHMFKQIFKKRSGRHKMRFVSVYVPNNVYLNILYQSVTFRVQQPKLSYKTISLFHKTEIYIYLFLSVIGAL